ncbi:SOS response-associated peptidase [Acanthopleuribacter pedis]|uniref:Abasic site processing protein n=1 Tax=Acanthopleuribacter pedis TaxID=442870 RepID=A0A8J7U5V3_9BACT|nr:SOS response-associated peptidase [Acanthopleuribacter pedis]
MYLPAQTIASFFLILNEPDHPPRYNIAPTQPVLAVFQSPAGRRGVPMRWGLIPHWARDIKIGAKLANARSETLHEKPSFRTAFNRRRCLIPADGFYEWVAVKGRKQPYFIRRRDGNPLAFAGLWEVWVAADQSELVSCTIVTTAANREMTPVHHRMPVILEPGQFDRWLDPDNQNPRSLCDLMRPMRDGGLVLQAVDDYVNRTGNEGPRCIEPAATFPTPSSPPEPPAQMNLFED